jgi:hypothetical protein
MNGNRRHQRIASLEAKAKSQAGIPAVLIAEAAADFDRKMQQLFDRAKAEEQRT